MDRIMRTSAAFALALVAFGPARGEGPGPKARPADPEACEVTVVDRDTGRPLAGATFDYSRSYAVLNPCPRNAVKSERTWERWVGRGIY